MLLKYSNLEERHHLSCVDTSERHIFIALNLEQLSPPEIQSDTVMLGNREGALASLLPASLLLGAGRRRPTDQLHAQKQMKKEEPVQCSWPR